MGSWLQTERNPITHKHAYSYSNIHTRGSNVYLQGVKQHSSWPHRHPESLHGIVEGLHHVRRFLEDIGPHIVHEVNDGILTTKSHHTHTRTHILTYSHTLILDKGRWFETSLVSLFIQF